MKPFHTIAVPHKDILEGRLTMDVFAADLWEAFHNRGVAEYKDGQLFFQKTYYTEGLKNLLNIIQRRLKEGKGDPVIQIQTPFGGGKTHSLIAIMHKAKEWKSNVVVIVGTNLSAQETLWGLMEKQLTGKNTKLTGLISPGKEKIKSILTQYQPTVILIDELLEYIVKASGVKVGESSLAAQTFAFVQELSETVSSLENLSLVVTLPTSSLEHYDEKAETFLAQLQKISGRIEKIYTPVNEQEISKVIRKRLFSSVDEEEVLKNVNNFIEYATKENILPVEMESNEYRDRFVESYPFLPEVIDILYHRWGSFTTFQRTRGVLRILSLVVHSLKDSQLPYISLADFNLSNQEIRQELIKHIGNEYNSVIAQDITDVDAGSKKIDENLGDSYRGLKIATRTANTIFLYSFSGGIEKGATLMEIKRSATTLQNPSSVVSEALAQMKSKLFYTQFQNDKYYFSNTPNINKMILNKIENISETKIIETEKQFVESQLSNKGYFKFFIWEENPSNISDTQDLKLIILREVNEKIINQIIKTKGQLPRVYCNTVLFLCPDDLEHNGLIATIKNYLAYESLLHDKTFKPNKDQRKEIEEKVQKHKTDVMEMILRAYQCLLIPSKDGVQREPLGIPTYGENKKIDERVYERLRGNKILESISSIVIKQKYIQNQFVSTKNLLDSFYKTPGEVIITNIEVLKNALINGVKEGEFGIGEVVKEQVKCNYYKQKPEITFNDYEVLIKSDICEQQMKINGDKQNDEESFTVKSSSSSIATLCETTEKEFNSESKPILTKEFDITFDIPKGKISEIMRFLSNIKENLEKISLTIKGTLSEQQYENTIKETLTQLKIDYKDNTQNEKPH